MSVVPAVMPLRVGVRLTHATVQAIAEAAGVDVLHIKGPAVDPSLQGMVDLVGPCGEVRREKRDRHSIDVDVLVRPTHVQILLDQMRKHAWRLKVDFSDGSSFEHAATMSHPRLAHVDVHRSFPGFGPDAELVFDRLWRNRQTTDIAGRPCTVPDLTAQRLVLVLNAVRGGPAQRSELHRLWHDASEADRVAVRELAEQTGAQVALAAADGTLADHVGSREHDLWELLSTGRNAPLALWRARVRAQPTFRTALREAVKLVAPNPNRLALELGRPPTRRDLAEAWARRLAEGWEALLSMNRSRRRHR